jgi:hypothetical protein
VHQRMSRYDPLQCDIKRDNRPSRVLFSGANRSLACTCRHRSEQTQRRRHAPHRLRKQRLEGQRRSADATVLVPRENWARNHSEMIVRAAVQTDAMGTPSPTARRLASASPTAVPAQRSAMTIDQKFVEPCRARG